MFNKKDWVVKSLKSGYDKGVWTAEHIMENAMKYSMAGVLDDADLEELAVYTEPVVEEELIPNEATGEEHEGAEESINGEDVDNAHQSSSTEDGTENAETTVDETNM